MSNYNSLKALVSQAMGDFLQEKYEESINLFSEALSIDATHKVSLVSRGSAYLRLDHPQKAIADFDRVLDLYPDYTRAYHLRGLAREQQGDDIAALSDFNRAIELDSGYGAAYASRANVHQKLGNDELSANDMQVVMSLTTLNLESFANEHNVWQTQHMRVEDAIETELNR